LLRLLNQRSFYLTNGKFTKHGPMSLDPSFQMAKLYLDTNIYSCAELSLEFLTQISR
jgi:hypothetical protein